ncbi:MAG: hypothetical protein V3S64_14895 [bacterium]
MLLDGDGEKERRGHRVSFDAAPKVDGLAQLPDGPNGPAVTFAERFQYNGKTYETENIWELASDTMHEVATDFSERTIELSDEIGSQSPLGSPMRDYLRRHTGVILHEGRFTVKSFPARRGPAAGEEPYTLT